MQHMCRIFCQCVVAGDNDHVGRCWSKMTLEWRDRKKTTTEFKSLRVRNLYFPYWPTALTWPERHEGCFFWGQSRRWGRPSLVLLRMDTVPGDSGGSSCAPGGYPVAGGIPGDLHRGKKHPLVPSGKLTELWKIIIFHWKTHYKLPFSIAMLVYQRVYNWTSLWKINEHQQKSLVKH